MSGLQNRDVIIGCARAYRNNCRATCGVQMTQSVTRREAEGEADSEGRGERGEGGMYEFVCRDACFGWL